jgi:hypothetical protein
MQFCRGHWLKRARIHKTDIDWRPRYVTGLERVIDWVEARGYSVDFSSTSNRAWLTPDKAITVPSAHSAHLQLMYLLHEAGHVSVECSKPTKRYSRGYNAPQKSRQLNYVIDVIDEELEAWERGRQLAHRLGIKLDDERYNRLKVRSVKTYALLVSKWHVKRRVLAQNGLGRR